jgi:hypothetical protein
MHDYSWSAGPLEMGSTDCPKTSVTTNLHCITPQKIQDLNYHLDVLRAHRTLGTALKPSKAHLKPLQVDKQVSANPTVYLSSHRTYYISELGPSCSITVYC